MATTFIGVLLSWILLILGKTAFLWAPVILMYVGLNLWHHFVTERFILGMTWTLFEIHVPRDVEKSPMAMELIFTNAMYHASGKGFWDIWIVGAPHFWFSLEIAGVDGSVRFYVRTPSRIRDLVETQIYAQYPQAKVREADDYTLAVPYDAPNKDWMVWGCEYVLKEHDALPIRTYVDYGLDKPSDKEDLKIDPLTPTIEFLGSLHRGQQIWIQHVIRPSLKPYHGHGGHHQCWVEEAHDEMNRIMEPYSEEYFQTAAGRETKSGPTAKRYTLPKPIEDKVEKIRGKIMKLGFDVGIRVIAVGDARYCSEFDFKNICRASRLLFRQYAAPDGNSFVRMNGTGYDTQYADPTGKGGQNIKNRALNWYRHRFFYHPPLWHSISYPWFISLFYKNNQPKYSVLNVEEIATIFHFPGQVSQAPSFKRVESRTAKPPANLPI